MESLVISDDECLLILHHHEVRWRANVGLSELHLPLDFLLSIVIDYGEAVLAR